MNALLSFELIVSSHTWRQAVMALLRDREAVATGSLLRDPGRHPAGMLLHELTVTNPPRTGDAFPPLGSWAAVAVASDGATDPDVWVHRLQPRFAQTLAILLLGPDPHLGSWRGWMVQRGTIFPLAGLRVVGPGMVRVRSSGDTTLAVEPTTRWTRVRGAVGERPFARIRETKAAVIGSSRTGTLAAQTLTALGVRALTLIDGDSIEPHNLDGMVLSAEADIGANKAVALGRRLIEYRPDLVIQAVRRPFDLLNAEALAGTDLLVTCVDQDGPRLRAALWARDHLAVHLDVGTGVTQTAQGDRLLAADVRLLVPGAGCVRCVGGLGDVEQAEYEVHAPAGALPRRPPEVWNARARLGSLITLNSMAVSFGVQSWLDLLEGALSGSIWHRLRWRLGAGLEVNSGLVSPGIACRICSQPELS